MKDKDIKDPDEKVVVSKSFELPDCEDGDGVSESYTPEGFKSQDEYLKDLREDYAADLESDRLNREQAVDDKNFAAGEQWDPIVLDHRKGLPCLVINSVPQFTAQVVGDWRTNRNAIKVVPNDDGHVDIAAVRGDLVRSIEMKSRASRVYDSAFESAVQCGDGAFRVSVDYARDDVFDQEITIRPIEDALSVVWDRMSIDPTGSDATRCFVDDALPLKDFKRQWPEADPSTLSNQEKNALRGGGWFENDTVRVTEHWRMLQRHRLLGLFQDGSIHELNHETMDAIIEKHGKPIRSRVAPCMFAQMHLVTGFKILAGPYEYRLNRLPIIRMSGRVVNVNGRRIRYGLVRFMKDPVRMRNFWRSVAAEQLGYAPKAQWLAPESAVEGREDDFRKAHLSRDPLLVYNDDATVPPERIEPPAVQAALLNEAAVNTQDMKDVTGIHDASLGMKSNETSGKAIMARQREGDIANLTYHDNGNAAILEAGDVINQLIPQIYDGTRVVRTVGQDEEAKFVRVNDPMDPKAIDLSVGNYDVALDTGTSYMTRRVEAAAAMMDAVQVWPEMMQIAGDLVAKAQDWPGAQELAERLKKTIPPALLGPDEQGGAAPAQPAIDPKMVQQAMQHMQELQKENDTLKAKHDIDLAKLDIDRYKAETDRIKALSDNQVDATELEQNAIAGILDHSRGLAEMQARRELAESAAAAKANQTQPQSKDSGTPG